MNENVALINLFVKYYHMKNSNIKIYKDNYTLKMLNDKEYKNILKKLNNISFCSFTKDYIVNTYLAPKLLASQIINEMKLSLEIKVGAKQFIYINPGYDMLGYKYKNVINVYEIDTKQNIKDKLIRIKKFDEDDSLVKRIVLNNNLNKSLIKKGFDKNKKTYVSLLNLSKENLKAMLNNISYVLKEGSSVLFNYDKDAYLNDKIDDFLLKKGFYVYEVINDTTINNKYFYNYNTINPDNKIILNNTVYIFTVKKS